MSTVPKVEKSCYIQWPKGKFEFIIYIESKFRLWLEFLTLGFFFLWVMTQVTGEISLLLIHFMKLIQISSPYLLA